MISTTSEVDADAFVLHHCRIETVGATGVVDAGAQRVDDGAIAVQGGRIAWVGRADALPASMRQLQIVDLQGRLVTPGLADCCTPPLPPAARIDAEGLSGLLQRSRLRLLAGVTLTEWRVAWPDHDGLATRLRVLREGMERAAQRVRLTLVVPPVSEADSQHDALLEHWCNEVIPQLHAERLVDVLEVQCEEAAGPQDEPVGFNLDDASLLLESAYRKKLPTRIACEQYSDSGGAALAPAFYARAAAMLNHCDELGVSALAQARTVALLLPWGEPMAPQPPVAELRRQGVPIALGTFGDAAATPRDAAQAGCRRFGLTSAESLAAVTDVAARVLAQVGGQATGTGLSHGATADLVAWDADSVERLVQGEAASPHGVWIAGRPA